MKKVTLKEVLIAVAVLLMFIIDHSMAHAVPVYHYTGKFASSGGDDYQEMLNHQCLSMIVHLESRNQGARGVELVAMTTLNRVMDRRWSNSVCDVIVETSQYEPMTNQHKEIAKRISAGEIFAFQEWVENNQSIIDQRAYFKHQDVALSMMSKQHRSADWLDILYFYSPSSLARRNLPTPGWIQRTKLVVVHLDHHFMSDKRG